jgi:serine-type D-Ala-D-Ala carboxypeptidase (penicillin-binding protein 5/6)
VLFSLLPGRWMEGSVHRPVKLDAVESSAITGARRQSSKTLRLMVVALTSLGMAFLGMGKATAQGTNVPAPATLAVQSLAAPQIAARSFLLLDATTGQVLIANQPDLRIDPASLTKLMTAYLVFGALREKRLTLDARPPVSQLAYKAIGSRMFVDPAKPASVEELLKGMIVQSGNDATVVLAEAVATSEDAFVKQMNDQARRLGMKNTQFANSSGLPAPLHATTANDLAILAVRLMKDYPEYYPLYAIKDYTYNNIKQPNRNRLLFIDPSVDGLKTGHTDAAGWCLIASSLRDQTGTDVKRRLISIVIGAGSDAARTIESQKLLNWGFQNTEAVRVFLANKPAGQYEVWKGQKKTIAGGFTEEVLVSVPKAQVGALKADIERNTPLVAPLAKGQNLGTLKIRLGDQVIRQVPLVALEEVSQAGFFGRGWDTMRLWVNN